MLGACSPRVRDPPMCGRESEKRSLPYTWAPLEDCVRSLLMSPSSVDSEKRQEEGRKKATVTVCREGQDLVSGQLDEAEETLVSLSESLLVKDLDEDGGRRPDSAVRSKSEEGRSRCAERKTDISKCWFHAGERVRLTAFVVYVWSPSTETTAKGSGRLKTSRLTRELAARTVHGVGRGGGRWGATYL